MGKNGQGRESCRGGFTLLETVMAMAVFSAALLFLTGFLAPQLNLYYRFGRFSEAKQICGRAYRELEESLRYGYDFSVDPQDTGILYYRVRREIPAGDYRNSGEKEDARLRLDGSDLENAGGMGMELEVDFCGTDGDTVRMWLRVREEAENRVIWEQEACILSMYGEPETEVSGEAN